MRRARPNPDPDPDPNPNPNPTPTPNEALLGPGLARLAAGTTLTGTSIFDPTLCESAYTWFP